MTTSELQPEPTPTTQTLSPVPTPTVTALETEEEARIARLIAQRLHDAGLRSLRAERVYTGGSLLMIACALPVGCLLPALANSGDPFSHLLSRFLLATLFLTPILTYCVYRLMKPRFDADEIARVGGVKAIAPLIVMLRNALPPAQENAVYALLTLLLPRMKASDATLLTPASRQIIHSWLNRDAASVFVRGYPDSLRIAAFKALEQVGDSTAIPYVERVAQGRGALWSHEAVRQAARDCLPMLRANYSKVEASRMLLRASQAEKDPPHLLLRSATGIGYAAPQGLLRGSNEPLPSPSPPLVQE